MDQSITFLPSDTNNRRHRLSPVECQHRAQNRMSLSGTHTTKMQDNSILRRLLLIKDTRGKMAGRASFNKSDPDDSKACVGMLQCTVQLSSGETTAATSVLPRGRRPGG